MYLVEIRVILRVMLRVRIRVRYSSLALLVMVRWDCCQSWVDNLRVGPSWCLFRSALAHLVVGLVHIVPMHCVNISQCT